MSPLSPEKVRELISSGNELAILDLREEGVFSKKHLLFATNLPLSRLEFLIANLVPRRSVMIVLCGKGDDKTLIAQGGERLQGFGYRNIFYLDGGIDAWEKSGFQLFSGINVPSKAFGEFVEEKNQTPHISAIELDRLIASKGNIVILDSRPMVEYQLKSIPGAINVPGAELAYRILDLAPNPETKIIVNCAGRTRSIIGAQSLINAGIPNPVMALENGTMGWHLAGKKLTSGKRTRYPKISTKARAQALLRSKALAKRFKIKDISIETLMNFLADSGRTTYIFDVRDPTDFEAGHVQGSISAPGGQLVQATDQYVGVIGSRLVLVDDDDIRAVITASWLKQMGWFDVFVLKGGIKNGGNLNTGRYEQKILGYNEEGVRFISAAQMAEKRGEKGAHVIDLANSLDYRDNGHIPGAYFAIRARLNESITQIGKEKSFILTSSDGVLATLASKDQVFFNLDVQVLKGGTAAWETAGFPLEKGFSAMLNDPVDRWYRPYDLENGVDERAMEQYLCWEVNLVPQISLDGTAKFFILSDNNSAENI